MFCKMKTTLHYSLCGFWFFFLLSLCLLIISLQISLITCEWRSMGPLVEITTRNSVYLPFLVSTLFWVQIERFSNLLVQLPWTLLTLFYPFYFSNNCTSLHTTNVTIGLFSLALRFPLQLMFFDSPSSSSVSNFMEKILCKIWKRWAY